MTMGVISARPRTVAVNYCLRAGAAAPSLQPGTPMKIPREDRQSEPLFCATKPKHPHNSELHSERRFAICTLAQASQSGFTLTTAAPARVLAGGFWSQPKLRPIFISKVIKFELWCHETTDSKTARTQREPTSQSANHNLTTSRLRGRSLQRGLTSGAGVAVVDAPAVGALHLRLLRVVLGHRHLAVADGALQGPLRLLLVVPALAAHSVQVLQENNAEGSNPLNGTRFRD